MEIKNRIVRSATELAAADDAGYVTDEYIEIYRKLAEGGVTSRDGDTNVQSVKMKTVIRLPENLDFISRRLEAEVEPVVMRILQEELKY